MKYEYLDIEQTKFIWTRPNAGYLWDEETSAYDLETISFSKTDEPVLLESPESTGEFITNPLDNSGLFLEFAELDITREAIQGFANDHGLLKRKQSYITPRIAQKKGSRKAIPKVAHADVIHGDMKYGMVYGEPYSLWAKEIVDMKLAVTIYEALDGDIKALEGIIIWAPENDVVRLEYHYGKNERHYLLASTTYRHDFFERIKPGDIDLPARLALQGLINRKLNLYPARPRLLFDQSNNLEPYIVPSNLLSAIWFQVLQAAAGEKAYRRCRVCGFWEDITNRNKNWKAHAACANKDRVYEWRKKQAMGDKK